MANKVKTCESSDQGKEPIETTKDKIIFAAIDLFAEKGYDAVSMREIAQRVGIQKSSLYSHFESKEEILDRVLELPASSINMIAPKDFNIEKMIDTLGVEGFFKMAGEIFNGWMEAPGMDKLWRIVTIEMYHNDKIKTFFLKFTGDAFDFWEEIFATMIDKGLIKPFEPAVLADEYLSFYLSQYVDHFIIKYDTSRAFISSSKKSFENHVNFFIYAIKKEC
jgi:AcrR family transcriptional regulator